MKVVIIGGSGPIGARTTRLLRQAGHEVASTGNAPGPALAGAQVVVDMTDAASCRDAAALEAFAAAQRALLAAEAAAGIGHHVALSVAGTERPRQGSGTRGRMTQERLIHASGLPYTLIHSTQLFEFLGGIARSAAAGAILRLPPAAVQPIAPDDVAAFVARIALGAPLNDTIEIAGPERLRLSELVARYLRATEDPRAVVSDIHARWPGTASDDRPPVPNSAPRLGMTRFEAWFHRARARA
ncbi:SDR family oxidoreductase [Inquilinus limosus]|uniref:NmrA family transcriptional regulator n=1 Tax=Inquilinus limosus TaxID=171674 RepID=A0A211ZQA6_9PROT|nr:SDR family oxidoreductase [Inquilinus limosus]OWJ67366.1 NmrA family transcriptional regulator [Inquilinus limosus]